MSESDPLVRLDDMDFGGFRSGFVTLVGRAREPLVQVVRVRLVSEREVLELTTK